MTDAEIGIGRVRTALAGLKSDYELVILLCGSLSDSISSELLLSVSDLALAEVRPHDHKARIATQIGELDSLPRQGGVLTFSAAYRGDPGLRHATEAADHCLCHHCAAVVAFAFLPHFTEHPS